MGGGEVDLSTFFFEFVQASSLPFPLLPRIRHVCGVNRYTLPTPRKLTLEFHEKKSVTSLALSPLTSHLSFNSTMSTAWQRFTYWLKSGPPAPGTAQRRLSTSTQKTFKRNPLTDLPLDDYLVKQLDASWTKLLANIHPNGSTPGAVVASPSKAKPDYW